MPEPFATESLKKKIWRWWMVIPAIYLVLLLASYIQRAITPAPELALLPDQHALQVPEIRDRQATGRQIRLAYLDYTATSADEASKGATENFSPFCWFMGAQGAATTSKNLRRR